VVSLRPGTDADEAELTAQLVAWCRDRLAHFKCPRTVDILPALPRTPTGKILKRELRRPYWEGRGRGV
jgi:acyl-coenzyme A synthetase/AMP-(fatty) acid ligase